MTDFISSREPAGVRPARPFRILVGAFSAMLAGFGAWVTATEWLSPAARTSAAFVERASDATDLTTIRLAAWIGLARGDLWADYAATLMHAARLDSKAQSLRDRAQAAGYRAATLAPLDPRPWLVLAELAIDSGAAAPRIAGMLNMSFLTSPNTVEVMPRRLALVARSPVRTDADIHALVLRDIRLLTQQADGIPRLGAVWRGATADGREYLAGILRDVDPKLLQDIPDTR